MADRINRDESTTGRVITHGGEGWNLGSSNWTGGTGQEKYTAASVSGGAGGVLPTMRTDVDDARHIKRT
jgi:hypothetical protein